MFDLYHVLTLRTSVLVISGRLQLELEASTKQAIFVGSSISDTIRTCIVLGNHRAAMRVRAEFKVIFFIYVSLFSFIDAMFL